MSARVIQRAQVFSLLLAGALFAGCRENTSSADQSRQANGEYSQEVVIGSPMDNSVAYFKTALGIDVGGSVLHEWVSDNLLHHSRWYLVRVAPSTYAKILKALQRQSDDIDKNPKELELAPNAPSTLKEWWVPPMKDVVGGRLVPNTDGFYLEYDASSQLLYVETRV